MEIQFLGSGDAFSSGARFQACLHLRGGGDSVLLDCGATSLVALKQARIDPRSIGYVALTHLHGDHFAGLPWLVLDGQFGGRTEPLVIAGPAGTRDRLREAFEALYPGSSKTQRDFEVTVLELVERTALELGPARITPFAVRHGGGATPYALRVEYGGRLIGYSGDTEWTSGLVDVAAEADLFVCECNFFDGEVPGHLNYLTLMSKRDHLTCKRIVLTHMSEEMLARADEVELEMAEDGTVVRLDSG